MEGGAHLGATTRYTPLPAVAAAEPSCPTAPLMPSRAACSTGVACATKVTLERGAGGWLLESVFVRVRSLVLGWL